MIPSNPGHRVAFRTLECSLLKPPAEKRSCWPLYSYGHAIANRGPSKYKFTHDTGGGHARPPGRRPPLRRRTNIARQCSGVFHSRSAPRLAGRLVDTGRRSDLWRSSHTLRAQAPTSDGVGIELARGTPHAAALVLMKYFSVLSRDAGSDALIGPPAAAMRCFMCAAQ